MGQPSPANIKYRVVIEKSSGDREVIVRDLPLDQAEQIQRAVASRYPNVVIEQQSDGENSLIQE